MYVCFFMVCVYVCLFIVYVCVFVYGVCMCVNARGRFAFIDVPL